MYFNDIVTLLIGKFGEEALEGVDEASTPPIIQIKAHRIAEICLELYEHEQTYFDYLACLSAIDNGPDAGTLEVIYHLYSIPYNISLGLKVQVQRNNATESLPQVPTVSYIWRTANWHEREAYDLLGIHFTGHPDMRRILLPADWEGHPLRKDYKLQEKYHGIHVAYKGQSDT